MSPNPIFIPQHSTLFANFFFLYSAYKVIYSKLYETGTSEYETEKMIKFIQSIKSPSIIMMVAQAEAFGQMTDEAWAIFVSVLLYFFSYIDI